MLPVLEKVAGGPKHIREMVDRISDDLKLTPEERSEMIPSGSGPRIYSRVHWAKTYLKQAGLVSQPTRGLVEITDRGRDVLANRPDRIDNEFLSRFPEFKEFQKRKGSLTASALDAVAEKSEIAGQTSTPEERIEAAAAELRSPCGVTSWSGC